MFFTFPSYGALPYAERAISVLPAPTTLVHIVDYTLFPNESDSVGRMRDVVDAIGRLRDDLVLENIVTGAPREIGIVHNVLPSTDWNTLFHKVYVDENGYAKLEEWASPVIMPFFSPRCYFHSVVPGGTVNLGYSVNCLHWLSSMPNLFPMRAPHPHQSGIKGGHGQAAIWYWNAGEGEGVRSLFAEKATFCEQIDALHWFIFCESHSIDIFGSFLRRRATELAPSAELVIILPGFPESAEYIQEPAQGPNPVVYGKPTDHRNYNAGIAHALQHGPHHLLPDVESGVGGTEPPFNKDTLHNIVLPIYYRTASEILAPLKSPATLPDINDAFEVMSLEFTTFDDPYMPVERKDTSAHPIIQEFAYTYVREVLRPMTEGPIIAQLLEEDWELSQPFGVAEDALQAGKGRHVNLEVGNVYRGERFAKAETIVDKFYEGARMALESEPAVLEHSYAVLTLRKKAA